MIIFMTLKFLIEYKKIAVIIKATPIIFIFDKLASIVSFNIKPKIAAGNVPIMMIHPYLKLVLLFDF